MLGDVWWTQVGQLGTPPGATATPGAGFDAVNRRLISYGGEDRNLVPFFLTFILDLKQH